MQLLKLSVLLLSILVAQFIDAETTVNQEIKLQLGQLTTDAGSLLESQGVEHYTQNLANYRFRFDFNQDNWSFDFDYTLNAEFNSELEKTQSLSFIESKPSNWFDWSNLIYQNSSSRYQDSIERANIVYTNAQWTYKIGRQAITWGNGILFHPMDLFNPFSPYALDTSYKPGVDMIYLQRLFDSGADLQMLWVPRKNNELVNPTESIEKNSFAAKYLFFVGSLQVDVMLADDYGDKTIGLGLVGSMDDAVWKMDITSNEFGNGNAISLDLNLQYSWSWADKPVNGFVEYYRNGFAPNKLDNLESLGRELILRLRRGQLFSLGKDQLAMGVDIQLSPLWSINPSLIYQLNDQSRLLLINLSYSSGNNSTLIAGVQLASGDKGSEYGGEFLTPLKAVTLSPTDVLYLRYEVYF